MILVTPVADTVISAEFLGSNAQERLATCRKLSEEAGKLAADAANPETQRAYVDLRRRWEALIAEIETTLEHGEPEMEGKNLSDS